MKNTEPQNVVPLHSWKGNVPAYGNPPILRLTREQVGQLVRGEQVKLSNGTILERDP